MRDALGAPSVWPSLLEQPASGAPGSAEPAPGVAGACAPAHSVSRASSASGSPARCFAASPGGRTRASRAGGAARCEPRARFPCRPLALTEAAGTLTRSLTGPRGG